MKKLLRISVVLAMVLCLSLTAFASSTSGTRVERAVGSDGNEVQVVEAPTTETPTVEDIVAAFPGDRDLVEGEDPVDPENLTVAWLRDLEADIPEGGSVTITFEVPGVTDDQHVYVLHFDGNSWEIVGQGFGSVVEATFTSLSPVAILVEKAPTTDPGRSPQTGEQPTLLVAASVVLLAGAVAVVAMKKKEEM